VLHSGTSMEYRAGRTTIVPTIVGVHARGGDLTDTRKRLANERAIDEVLTDSFPASDPPSWNSSVARPDLVVRRFGHQVALGEANGADSVEGGTSVHSVINAARSMTERTFFQGFVSLTGAVGIALMAPFVVLLLGLPVVVGVRALLEAIGWLFGGNVL
jgi:hypothetical protein